MYSQNDEEKYILEAVGCELGTFLDIGAYDGKTFSNTAALADRGWSGVLVEPSIHAFAALKQRYVGNPRLQLVHAAVGPECGIVKFWESRDAVSTTSEKHHELWKVDAAYGEPYFIPEIPLSLLRVTFPVLEKLDVLSIDTEGTSGNLLLEWGYADIPWPKVVVVEYDQCDKSLTAYAKENGFEAVYKSSENLVLVHESCRNRAQVSNR